MELTFECHWFEVRDGRRVPDEAAFWDDPDAEPSTYAKFADGFFWYLDDTFVGPFLSVNEADAEACLKIERRRKQALTRACKPFQQQLDAVSAQVNAVSAQVNVKFDAELDALQRQSVGDMADCTRSAVFRWSDEKE
jgi:hypothetical protein